MCGTGKGSTLCVVDRETTRPRDAPRGGPLEHMGGLGTVNSEAEFSKAINVIAWQVGALPEVRFNAAWDALGFIARSVALNRAGLPVEAKPKDALVWA